MADAPNAGVVAPSAPAQITTLQSGFSGGGGGSAARRLMANGFDINCLRQSLDGPANPADPSLAVNGAYGNRQEINVNATLMRDEWIQFDNVVQQVARERLVVTQALMGRGLTYNLPNAMGTMTLEWQQIAGDLVDAEVTMSGLNEATKDRLEFTEASMPIPIFHKEFFYNLRHLEAARRNGRNVETEHAAVATRKVAELVEKTIFTGLTIAGGTIYGLANHPARKTLSVTATWVTATGIQIVTDIRRMRDILMLPPNNMEGPYILFVPITLASRFEEDYAPGTNVTDTILDRAKRVTGIADIVFTSRLTGTQALLVQLTPDVVQIINGLQPTLVEWDSHAGFQHNFKIFAIMPPRVRANGWAQSGIAHIS